MLIKPRPRKGYYEIEGGAFLKRVIPFFLSAIWILFFTWIFFQFKH